MVILVDKNDRVTGESPKLEAHRNGLLHRAFSVLIFDSMGRMLIQQRDSGKYHSPGLWANSCCSHPLPGEVTIESAMRRLEYEMGISADLVFRASFIYRADVGGDLTEHEYDHIFTGHSDAKPYPNIDEVMSYRYADIDEIISDINRYPEQYCTWFRIILSRYHNHIKSWIK